MAVTVEKEQLGFGSRREPGDLDLNLVESGEGWVTPENLTDAIKNVSQLTVSCYFTPTGMARTEQPGNNNVIKDVEEL